MDISKKMSDGMNFRAVVSRYRDSYLYRTSFLMCFRATAYSLKVP